MGWEADKKRLCVPEKMRTTKLPANLQSENPQAAEPEAENVLGRSCCVAAFVVLFSHEDEGKLLTVIVLSS